MSIAAIRPVQADSRLLIPGDHAGNYNKVVSAFQKKEKVVVTVESMKFYTDKRSFETMEAAQSRQAARIKDKSIIVNRLDNRSVWMVIAAFVGAVAMRPLVLAGVLSFPVGFYVFASLLAALELLAIGTFIYTRYVEGRKPSEAEKIEDQSLLQMKQKHSSELRSVAVDTAGYMLERYNRGDAGQRRQVVEDARSILKCTVRIDDMQMMRETAAAIVEKAKLAKKQD